DSDSLT
ncbi:hypothetical protein JL09_g6167, partial [Pichia kudriavzevii]